MSDPLTNALPILFVALAVDLGLLVWAIRSWRRA